MNYPESTLHALVRHALERCFLEDYVDSFYAYLEYGIVDSWLASHLCKKKIKAVLKELKELQREREARIQAFRDDQAQSKGRQGW